MKQTLYISYSNSLAEFAHRICFNLENFQYKCWISPRNILYNNIQLETDAAIKNCELFISLYNQEYSNDPTKISELKLAIDSNKLVYIFRLEDAPLDIQLSDEYTNLIIIDVFDLNIEESGIKIINYIKENYTPNQQSSKLYQEDSNFQNIIPNSRLKTSAKPIRIIAIGIIIVYLFLMFLINFIVIKTILNNKSVLTEIDVENCGGMQIENNLDLIYFSTKFEEGYNHYSNISDIFSTDHISIIAKTSKTNYQKLETQLFKFNKEKEDFDFISSKNYSVDTSWNFFFFKDITINDEGIFRILLADEQNNVISSALLEKNLNGNELKLNNILYFCEEYKDKEIEICDRFTTGKLCVVSRLTDNIGVANIQLNILKLDYRTDKFNNILTEQFDINPEYNFIYINDVKFNEPGIYRVNISDINDKIIAQNLIEIVEK